MNGRQMKKGILWFLFACNLVLLVLIAVFGTRGALRTSAESRRTAELLQNRGVTITGDVYKALLEDKTAYTIRTDADARDTFSTVLLNGTAEAAAQSGGSIVWTGDTGSLTWAADSTVMGSVDLSVFGAMDSADAIERHITSLLKQGGVDMKQAAVECTEDDTGTVVRVQEGVNGKNLTGCELTFTVDAEGQAQVSGKWCLAEPEPIVLEGLDDSTPADILLALTKQHSDVTQVTAAAQVYVLSNKSGGRFTALPCWKLTTDQGEYIINPLTGEEVDENGMTSSADIGTDPSTGMITDPATGTITDPGTGTITDPATGTITDPGTVTDPGTGTVTDPGVVTDPSGTTDVGTETPSITDNSGTDSTQWDPSQGTDKTDPELPDENGIYG